MTNSHADLQAIRKKLRSLQNHKLATAPESESSAPEDSSAFTNGTEAFADLPLPDAYALDDWEDDVQDSVAYQAATATYSGHGGDVNTFHPNHDVNAYFAYAPDAYAPDADAPDADAPDAYAPDAYAPNIHAHTSLHPAADDADALVYDAALAAFVADASGLSNGDLLNGDDQPQSHAAQPAASSFTRLHDGSKRYVSSNPSAVRRSSSSSQDAEPSIQMPPNAQTWRAMAETVEALQQRSTQLQRHHSGTAAGRTTAGNGASGTGQTAGHGAAPPPDPVATANRQWRQQQLHLQQQIQFVNQMADAQRDALIQLRKTAAATKRWQRIAESNGLSEGTTMAMAGLVLHWDRVPFAVPRVQRDEAGEWLVLMQDVDLSAAQRRAEATAAQVRQQAASRSGQSGGRNRSAQSGGSLWSWLQQWLGQRQHQNQNQNQHQNQVQRNVHAPEASKQQSRSLVLPEFSIWDMAIWIAGAAIARIGLDWILATLPWTWPLVVALILGVAAVGIYQIMVYAESSLALGYRALLIMLGLLLGGRL